MFKFFRKKFRKVTFYLESTFQRKKLIKNPRPINVVRAWKMGNKDLATQIINSISSPLRIILSGYQCDKNMNVAVWAPIKDSESEFKINFDQEEEVVNLTTERIFHLMPLIKDFHASTFFKTGSIQVNLGDHADVGGLAFCSNRDVQTLIPDDSFVRTKGYQETRFFYQNNQVDWDQKKQLFFGVVHQLGYLQVDYGETFKE